MATISTKDNSAQIIAKIDKVIKDSREKIESMGLKFTPQTGGNLFFFNGDYGDGVYTPAQVSGLMAMEVVYEPYYMSIYHHIEGSNGATLEANLCELTWVKSKAHYKMSARIVVHKGSDSIVLWSKDY